MDTEENEQPYDLSIVASYASEKEHGAVIEEFRHADWSADGTCILTNGVQEHGFLSTFVLPPDLLTSCAHHSLTPYSTATTAEQIYSTAAYPGFNLSSPSTTLILTSTKDHPIQLLNSLALPTGPIASYPLINPNTEAYLAPTSMVFTRSGTHFLTGTDGLVCAFDLSRPNSGPVERHPTAPSRKAVRAGAASLGVRGIPSTMSVSAEGVLAVGTFGRMVGLYAQEGRGECEMFFELGGAPTSTLRRRGGRSGGREGSGITQVRWSACSRYLFVAERRSDVISVFDIRGGAGGGRLAALSGRRADTNQRLGFDVVPCDAEGGMEVWAGGTDGKVRVWKNPQHRDGLVDPACEFHAHEDPIVTTLVHPSGTVVATCSSPDRYANTSRSHALASTANEAEPPDAMEASSSSSAESSPASSESESSDQGMARHSIKIWSVPLTNREISL